MICPVISDVTRKLPVYVTTAGTVTEYENVLRPNGFPNHQLSLITRGKGMFFCEGESYELSQGCVFLFKKDVPHRYYLDGSCRFSHSFITFDGDASDILFENITPRGHIVFPSFSEMPHLLDVFTSVCSALEACAPEAEFAASSSVYGAMMSIAAYSRFHRLKKPRLNEKLLNYISANFSSDFSLDDMAAALGESKFSLCRAFRENFGTTVVSYLTQYRLQRAKAFLISSSFSVAEISRFCGFNDVSYFISRFKSAEGLTPAQFRKRFFG